MNTLGILFTQIQQVFNFSIAKLDKVILITNPAISKNQNVEYSLSKTGKYLQSYLKRFDNFIRIRIQCTKGID